MFEQLFVTPELVREHEEAPYRAEREQYLTHCLEQHYASHSVCVIALDLLWIARTLHAVGSTQGEEVPLHDVQALALEWAARDRPSGNSSARPKKPPRFIRTARPWLRFLGYWQDTCRPSVPFAPFLEDYHTWMDRERGFTAQTIAFSCACVRHFLLWYAGQGGRPLAAICLQDVDRFLACYGSRCSARTSLNNMAGALKACFRYAASRGLLSPSLADMIHGPRIYSQERLPWSLSWQEVQRLVTSMETDRPVDIRDRPMVMLCAIYGLRALEVVSLRLDDLDWEHNLLAVRRAKCRGTQVYPLVPSVGNAILRYVRELRPRAPFREVFLKLHAPIRPLDSGALFSMVSPRLKKFGIRHSHLGSHALRHACAEHLVADGFSLKEIGDHLGHRSSSSTRIYAKVDLASLRKVAAFDLGGLS